MTFIGRHHTDEAKAKMRAKKVGKYLGSNNPNFGKHPISPFLGKQHTEETRAKLRAKATGKHASLETKAKMAKAHLGKHSPKFGLKEKLNPMFGKIGDKHPCWKGDKVTPNTGRIRAEKLFPCPKGMERHHIDGNPLNNVPENISFVTRKQHLILDGRLDKLHARL